MKIQRRSNYFKKVSAPSISIFYSGSAPHLSNDSYYRYEVNKNFWYLTGIDQENSCLLLVKSLEKEEAFLFIKKQDPLEALWTGETLSFEDASKISQIPLSNIKDIDSFDNFLASLFTQTRKALFGPISTVYFDIERQKVTDEPLLGERKARKFAKMYPHIKIENSHIILADLRSQKDNEEIEAIKGAIHISNLANQRMLDTLKQAKFEYDVEAEFNYVLNKHQTRPAFNSIIASGVNATVLHYEDNNQPIEPNSLILLDLGVRYRYYASDITRTYPVNGKFTKRQKEIYQAVLNVNKAIIKWAKAGITQFEYNQMGKNLLIKEAKAIGLIKEDEEINKYYYHSLGHPLGLDVHDVSDPTQPFKVGQVITVEPGLYVKEEGIGVRIEDNLLLTENGCINLSDEIIKEVDDIEAYLAKK